MYAFARVRYREQYDPKRHQAQKMSIGNVLTSIDIHALSIIINSLSIIINSIKGVLKHFDDQTYL